MRTIAFLMPGRPLLVAAGLLVLTVTGARGQVPAARGAGGAAFYHLAIEAQRRGDDTTAAALFEATLLHDPTAVLPRLDWAAVLLGSNRVAAARAVLAPLEARADALSTAEPHLAARFYRLEAAAASRAGEPQAAVALYEKAALYAPADLGLRAQLIALHRERGAAGEALVHLEAAAALVPGSADLRVELGRALLDLERWEDADRVFREALAIQVGMERAWDGLGRALVGQRRYRLATEALRAGLSAAPGSALLYEHLGDVLMASGQAEAALSAYRRAKVLAPADPAVLDGKIGRAREALSPLEALSP